MAGKTLYEILGVAKGAAPEVVTAAYGAQREKIGKGPKNEGTAALSLAVEEAYRTLGNPQLRAAYDRKLLGMAPVRVVAAAPVDERSWLARNLISIFVLLCVVAVSVYAYESYRRQALETQRALEEKQKKLEAEKAELEAKEAERQRADDEAKARVEAQQQYIWEQQVRARAGALARQQQYQQVMDQAQAQREQQQEDFRRRQEEVQAKIRLQQEKQKLRQMQCASGIC